MELILCMILFLIQLVFVHSRASIKGDEVIPANGISFEENMCRVDLDQDAPHHLPYLLQDDGEPVLPVLKNKRKVIYLRKDEEITVACTGNNNMMLVTGSRTARLRCWHGTTFIVWTPELSNPLTVKFKQLDCALRIDESVLRYGPCGSAKDKVLVGIGWEIERNFYEQIRLCFDEKTYTTLYAKHLLYGASINARYTDLSRPSFVKGDFFDGVSMNRIYRLTEQCNTMLDLLGSTSLVNEFMSIEESNFFSKGHYAPNSDFIYESWQRATYYYIEVAPQWQSFNSGSWASLENAIRQYAAEQQANVVVYTGTYKILTHEDINGNMREIYLNFDKHGSKVPVPKFFWKIIHDLKSNKAIGFIGINNPHLKTVPSDYVLCEDICDAIPWVDFERKNIEKGYLYCCEVSQLEKIISYLPNFGNVYSMAETKTLKSDKF